MAELRQNTWELNKWYAESVAGAQGPYVGLSETWVFGYNDDSGYLGQNSIINRSSPVQLSGNNWNTSAFRTNFGSPSSSAALVPKTDGTLWVWGIGSEGQLGLNQSGFPAKISSPTQIPGISASSTFSIGELVGSSGGDDGELFVWGRNYTGTFGQNGAIDPNNSERRSSPVQIAGTTWRSINGFSDGSYDRMMATKTDGTLWMWGTNGSEGLLGLNQNGPTSQYSSPTQVGTILLGLRRIMLNVMVVMLSKLMEHYGHGEEVIGDFLERIQMLIYSVHHQFKYLVLHGVKFQDQRMEQ